MLLDIKGLDFSYPSAPPLFEQFSLSIGEGSITALAGESGCGKSTLLGLIYGLYDWAAGEIIFDGRKLLGPKGNLVPGEADMKLVAQHYDLMPYATVFENVGKFISNINLHAKRETVMQLLEVVGMEEYADVLPKKLSGGQQQRVAIARALSAKPKMLLLDEPFSNLDFSRKVKIRERMFRYIRENGIALLISTHDLPEVLPWLEQIIVLKNGRIVQNDLAEKVYRAPLNGYVAGLFGEVNVLNEQEVAGTSLPKSIWYPQEITASDNGYPAEVLESRFAGSHYWNRIIYKGVVFIMYSYEPLSGTVRISFKQS